MNAWMKRSSLIETLQTHEFAGEQIELKCFTDARLKAGNPWPGGLRTVTKFKGTCPSPGPNPRWTYRGLIYESKPGEWCLTFIPTERHDYWEPVGGGETLDSAIVVPWLVKPPEVNAVRSISLRSISWIRLWGELYEIVDG